MLDVSFFPTPSGIAEVSTFVGSTGTSGGGGANTFVWQKPRGKSMIDILLVGAGGAGGTGAIGANLTASGGGGGGSGGQTRVTMPIHMIPDVLYITLNAAGSTCRVLINPTDVAMNRIAIVNCGANGGNASGATAGTAGSAGGVATAANMPLGWNFATAVAGQAGTSGGPAGNAGGSLTLPVTGLLVTGGTGGGSLGAAAAQGLGGGAITAAGAFSGVPGGVAGATDTTPPGNGISGYVQLPLRYGGTGGASTRGSAVSTGLVQSSGGNGAPGCGGGGSGGALTGSTPGSPGIGGPAFCIITVW